MNFLEQRRVQIIDNCPTCKGKNSLCNCYTQYSLDIKKHTSGIPVRFFDLNLFNTSVTEEHKIHIKSFLSNQRQGLYFEGGMKTSRTELLCAILIKCIEQNKTCYFIDPLTCAQISTKQWSSNENPIYTKLIKSDVVAFNDLGDERKHDSHVVEDAFDHLIRDRLYSMKQILVSSSYSIEQFASVYTKDRFELIASSFKVLQFPQANIQNIFRDVRS